MIAETTDIDILFCVYHRDLVDRPNVSVTKLTIDMFCVFFLFIISRLGRLNFKFTVMMSFYRIGQPIGTCMFFKPTKYMYYVYGESSC